VNDYLLHEMARIRIDELQAEAARVAEKAQGSRGSGRYLGFLAGLWTPRAGVKGYSRGTIEEACCA